MQVALLTSERNIPVVSCMIGRVAPHSHVGLFPAESWAVPSSLGCNWLGNIQCSWRLPGSTLPSWRWIRLSSLFTGQISVTRESLAPWRSHGYAVDPASNTDHHFPRTLWAPSPLSLFDLYLYCTITSSCVRFLWLHNLHNRRISSSSNNYFQGPRDCRLSFSSF